MSLRSALRHAAWTAAALAAFTGCSTVRSAFDTGTGTSASKQAAEVRGEIRSDADIMGTLHQTNLGEIHSGNIAGNRASDRAVRELAAMLVRDHSALDRQGSAKVQDWGMTPRESGRLAEILRTENAALNAAGGGVAFDRTYIANQIMDHERTLAIIDAALGMTQRAELRAMLADQVRPRVAAHLRVAQEIQGRVGAP